MSTQAPGAFTSRFASRRRWRFDGNLAVAIAALLDPADSVIDLGAGVGLYVKALRTLGFDASGLDAITGIEELSGGAVCYADLAKPLVTARHSWAICIEVGEHIPEEFEPIVLNNIANAATKGLVVSWATPGQRGRGHVNCRSPEYIIEALAQRGWELDRSATERTRELSGRTWRTKLLVLQRVQP